MDEELFNNDSETKLGLVIRKPQEGKTFICISYITDDTFKNIHIVLTMNTLSAGMQFFGRMEDLVGSRNIIVFNSKKETAGNCLHASNVLEVLTLINENPKIRVIVCCAHEKRIRNSLPKLFNSCWDSTRFRQSGRKLKLHIDEAHKYIPENREFIRQFNDLEIVTSITGYSGTPDNIWTVRRSDPLFYKIYIRDVEEELKIIRSKKYFGVNNCEFYVMEEETTSKQIITKANIPVDISQLIISRSCMSEKSRRSWYDYDFPFELGNELLFLSFLEFIIPKIDVKPNTFSYNFIPAFTRKATHYGAVEIILKHYPMANVIVINGNGTELWRNVNNKSWLINDLKKLIACTRSEEERSRLLEPSYQIQQLISDCNNLPTFITGFQCVGMSVTLINETLGNFDNVVMCHEHYSNDKLYQLCRFLFNYTSWSDENIARIKKTRFYSLSKTLIDICRNYEQSVERMASEGAGKTCSLHEIKGLAPVESTERELKREALLSIKITNPCIWKKFKIYDGNDEEEWRKINQFYMEIMGHNPKGKSIPKKNEYGFYECSTTKNVDVQSINDIKVLEKQSWWSTFQLQEEQYNYARIFVGYDDLSEPNEYTVYVKYVQIDINPESSVILKKYGKI